MLFTLQLNTKSKQLSSEPTIQEDLLLALQALHMAPIAMLDSRSFFSTDHKLGVEFVQYGSLVF